MFKILLWIVTLSCFGLVIYGFTAPAKTLDFPVNAQVLSASDVLPSPSPFISPTSIPTGLSAAIENELDGTSGTYGIVIKNLKTGHTYTKNSTRSFAAGSLYKLWIMAEVYHQIDHNTLKIDDTLTQTVADLNTKFSIPPDQAEKTSGTISLTVKDALTQMITYSDNYAALLLAQQVRTSAASDYVHTLGLTDTYLGVVGEDPKTTPSDVAAFFEKLYKNSISNSESMLDLLKKQQLNDVIPKYLPKNLVVAHKTGDFATCAHDAGIVYTSKGDYIIVVMSESDYPGLAKGRLANISQAAYKYFNR